MAVGINAGSVYPDIDGFTTIEHNEGSATTYGSAVLYVDHQEPGGTIRWKTDTSKIITPKGIELEKQNNDIHFTLPDGLESLSSLIVDGKLDTATIEKYGGITAMADTVIFRVANGEGVQIDAQFELQEMNDEKGEKYMMLVLKAIRDVSNS